MRTSSLVHNHNIAKLLICSGRIGVNALSPGSDFLKSIRQGSNFLGPI